MSKLEQFLQTSGFDEYPEQLLALSFVRDILSGGVELKDVENLINRILLETGCCSQNEEESPRW